MYPIVFANMLDRMRFDWDTECWNWNRSKVQDGYGRIGYKGKLYLAHRLSLHLRGWMSFEELANPKIVVMHTCDNPGCINPHHLHKGTQQENIADRKSKGRTAKHLQRRDAFGRFK